MRYQDASVCPRSWRSYVGLFLPLFSPGESFLGARRGFKYAFMLARKEGCALLLGRIMDGRRCKYVWTGENHLVGV